MLMKFYSTFFLFIQLCDAYKVLVFNPAFGASHSNFLGKISDILIDAGNDVTMLIPIQFDSKKYLVGSKKVKNIIRIEQDPRSFELLHTSGAEKMMLQQVWTMSTNPLEMLPMMQKMTTASAYQCEFMMKKTDMVSKLREEQFDLAMGESISICGFELFERIGVKSVINVDSVLFLDQMKYMLGEPSSSSYFPGLFGSNTDEMTLKQRMENLAGKLFSYYFVQSRYSKELAILNISRSYESYFDKTAFNFINSNPYLDYPSPKLPKTVFVGGMQVNTDRKQVKLSEEWNDVLNARNTTVLVSFGSIALSCDMPQKYKESLIRVFESMPETTFIWKYEIENATLVDHLPNVKLTTWMPQNDLLADERLTLFVTHGGLGSSIELAYQGKPAIVIPIMGDQTRNSNMLKRHGGVIDLQKEQFSQPEVIREAILTILNDPIYSQNAKKLARILQTQPNQPKDTVLKHCDFAVKFGSLDTLNSKGRLLNFVQFYSIDIVLILIIILLLILVTIFLILKSFLRILRKLFTRKICIALCDSYKVLVFNPAFGASHSNFLGKISDILIDAGNDVTMVIPTYMDSKKGYVGSKKVEKIIRIGQDPRALQMMREGGAEEIMKKQIWKLGSDMMMFLPMIKNFTICSGYQCEYIMAQTEIIENLKNQHFDLAIIESLYICGFAFLEKIGVKNVINAESILYQDTLKYVLGEPASTSYYPGLFSPQTDNMGIVDRMKNTAGLMFSYYFTIARYNAELEAINSTRTWFYYLDNIAFNMVNSNPYLDYPSPVLPKTVFIGGMQVNTDRKQTKLSKEWDDVLNLRKTTVLVSFGSNAYSSDMPDEFKAAFIKVFESMPETTFIWKYEIENATLVDHLPNVKLTTWMPQNDLLADERLTLFVTHGGLGSSVELAYQGKPSVVIPLMADQPRNAHMLTRHGGAVQLDKQQLSDSEAIRKAITTVLNNPKISENAKRLSTILQSQPNKPKEVVLKHCNFAVEFGPLETLNSKGRLLNFFQFHSIDIIAILIFAVLVIFFILHLIIKLIYRLFKKLFSTKTKTD
ncbi:unnamed protein product [Caenorhabditis angaria]|uniref:glucuronosyltransferase n=1 Tax=Caenorhabditis angaria TaxID=860376 RepID=A0A9P1IXE8_9PELO|nr:unnamed protein product [Caenorhabditis angaria]